MKFHVHIPEHPLDPRMAEFDSLTAFEAAAPRSSGNGSLDDSEYGANRIVRAAWPNGLVMPVPVRIGAGTVVMLGVLPTVRGWVGEDAEIPFVAFVRGQTENAMERKRAGIGMYDQELWRTPLDEPIKRGISRTAQLELRSTDFPLPQFVDADLGRNAAGEIVIVFDIGEGRVSLTVPAVAEKELHDA